MIVAAKVASKIAIKEWSHMKGYIHIGIAFALIFAGVQVGRDLVRKFSSPAAPATK